MDVKSLGYVVKHHFIQNDFKCTHLLAQTSEGHLMIIEVTPFDHNNGMKMGQLSASITPQIMVTECMKNNGKSKTKVCFLTHNGLDLYHIFGYSLFFKDPKADAVKLQMGEKFSIPLVYVKQDELKIESDGQRLRYYVETDERLTVFYDLLLRSNCEHLLDSSGPYTLFAPDNAMLEKAYGPNANALRSKTKNLDIIVCSYFVPGIYDRDYSGELSSIIGHQINVQNGVPVIPSQMVKEIAPMVVTRNGNMSIITSSTVFTSGDRSGFIIPTNLSVNLTISDIAFASQLLSEKLLKVSKQIRISMRKYIEIATAKLDELDDLDTNMILIEEQIDDLNRSRVKPSAAKLKALNDIQYGHIKIASKIVALQTNVEGLTKHIKNL